MLSVYGAVLTGAMLSNFSLSDISLIQHGAIITQPVLSKFLTNDAQKLTH